MAEDTRPSVAETAAIRWLTDNGDRYSTASRAMKAYYSGNGHVTGHASAGRRGAANRMVGRLEARGWLDEAGAVTEAGRRAGERDG